MSMQLPLLLAPAGSLLPDSLDSIANKVPFGDLHTFFILLAMAPSMVMLVILVVHQLRNSRIDNRPASTAKPQTEAEREHLARFMRDAIEQLNGIAAALHNLIPKARQTPDQAAPSAAAVETEETEETEEVSAEQRDTLDDPASRTTPLPLTSETPPGAARDKAIAQLAIKVRKLGELASRMRAKEQALKRSAANPQRAAGGLEQNNHYLTFTLGNEQFAVSTLSIHTVVGAAQLVAESSTPPKIRKAIRLQGVLVPVIDLGARFGGQPIELGRNSHIVILEVPSSGRSQLIGVVVDEVGDIVEFPTMKIEPPAASGSLSRDDFTLGMLMLDDRSITLLDISRGFSANELVLHSAARPTKQENQPA